MDFTKFDGPLFDVMTSCGRPEIFLEAVFSFLQRRTDFYKVNDDYGPLVGMPKGYAAKIASGIFTKYQRIEEERRAQEIQDKNLAPRTKPSDVPEAASEIEVVSVGDEEATIRRANDQMIVELPGDSAPSNDPSAAADTFNGADCGSYSWSQQQDDLDIKVFITKDHKKFSVKLSKRNLTVKATHNGETVVLLDGKLLKEVRETEMIWTVTSGEYIHISLEKAKDSWWESLLENDLKINLSTLDTSKPFDELDEGVKMQIQKLALQKEQKPQISQDRLEMLQKAWDAEGSPFKGQPFDPSAVNFN